MLPEEAREKLKKYESDLLVKQRRRQRRVGQRVRTPKATSRVRSESRPSRAVVCPGSSPPSMQETSRSEHLPQVPDSGHSSLQQTAAHLPQCSSRQEATAAVQEDLYIDQRDSQTGEFVPSTPAPPLPVPSLVPSSIPDSFTCSPGTQGQNHPSMAPVPPGQDLRTTLPGASGDNDK